MRLFIPALAATLAVLPAMAQQMPDMAPDHDVSGTYLLSGQGSPQTLTVEYSQAASTLRVNTPAAQGMGGYILYNFASKDAKMVMPQMQRYMDYSAVAARFAGMAQAPHAGAAGDDISITQGGTQSIAGYKCQETIVTNHTRNESASFCLTSDHVILSVTNSKGFSMVAQSLSYQPVPDADVQVPPGFSEFVMPQMPQGAMAPGAGGNPYAPGQ